VDRRRGRVRETRQVGAAADGFELAASLERLCHGHDVDRLAPFEELDHRGVDRGVRLAVEVRGTEELGDLYDGIAVDQDCAEHRLLSLEALRR
jgi:hypothetical protein